MYNECWDGIVLEVNRTDWSLPINVDKSKRKAATDEGIQLTNELVLYNVIQEISGQFMATHRKQQKTLVFLAYWIARKFPQSNVT